jgi:hypothetical protein
MNWTKIPTNLLISRTPDNELVAIVKYQLLWADLEYQPTDDVALRYMSTKQLASVKQYLNDIEAQVVSDIKSTVNHRGGQKTYYKKKQSLKQNADGQCDNQYDSQCENHTDGADKIRLDKIRKEKEISDDISKKKPIDFDTIFQAGGQLWTLPPNFRKLALTKYTESEIRAFEKTHSCHENPEDVCLNDIKHEEPKPKKPEKKSYGEQQKVKLTDEEYAKLQELYGNKLNAAIEKLDAYIASHNKKYASHYAVMRRGNWVYTEIAKDPDADIVGEVKIIELVE